MIKAGKEDEFAIEFKFFDTPNDNSRFVGGHFYLFKERLGNESEHSLLGLVISAMDDLIDRLENQKKITDADTFNADADLLFEYLDKSVWAGNDNPLDIHLKIESPINHFALPIGVEIFDGDKIYLLHGEKNDRLLWKKWGDEKPKSAFISKGTYTGTLVKTRKMLGSC